MSDGNDKAFDAAFLSTLKARDVALASASAFRILIDAVVKAGVDREEIEKAFRAKAGELIGRQYEDNAANLLRMMGGVARRKPGA
jgi:hypothetical protein